MRSKRGQSLIESCLVIAVVSILLMGMVQLSQIIAAKEILRHAAMRGARAKTVGLNRFMVSKVIDVAGIPNAGPMLEPGFYINENPWLQDLVNTESPGVVWDRALAATPSSPQYPLEKARIPEYLGSETRAQARYILDYEDWDDITHTASSSGGNSGGGQTLNVRTMQAFRLWVPMHHAFYADDSVDLEGEARMESHSSLYMDDLGW